MSSPPGTQEDRQRLKDFFDEVEALLKWAVEYRSRLVPEDIAENLGPAWAELAPSFDAVRKRLEQVDDEELRVRGLTSKQLALKLDTFGREKRLFEERYKRTVEHGTLPTRLVRRLLGRRSKVSAG